MLRDQRKACKDTNSKLGDPKFPTPDLLAPLPAMLTPLEPLCPQVIRHQSKQQVKVSECEELGKVRTTGVLIV